MIPSLRAVAGAAAPCHSSTWADEPGPDAREVAAERLANRGRGASKGLSGRSGDIVPLPGASRLVQATPPKAIRIVPPQTAHVAERGARVERIMGHTGHRSVATVRVYTRRSDAFADHAGSGLLWNPRASGAKRRDGASDRRDVHSG